MGKLGIGFLLALLLIFCYPNPVPANDLDLTTKFGVEMSGNLEQKMPGIASIDYDVGSGALFALEITDEIYQNTRFGFGMVLSEDRSLTDSEKELSFSSLYGIVKLKDIVGGDMTDKTPPSLFLLGHLGYGVLEANLEIKEDGDAKGGLYYGIGAGLEFSVGAQLELLYSVNNGSIYHPRACDEKLRYSKLLLTIGWSFDLQ